MSLNKSKIEWCDLTWNPVTGCNHGCEYCYARKMAKRFGTPYAETDNHEVTGKVENYNDTVRTGPYPYEFAPTFHKYKLNEPSKLKKPSKIFVCSMADLFGDWVPDEWTSEVFKSCEAAPQHKYLFLTKNPKRYATAIPQWKAHHGMNNIWLGTTITNNEDRSRVWELLNNTNKPINKFLSIEPLLGDIDMERLEILCKGYKSKFTIGNYIDWVIVGAQSGPGAVKPKLEWIRSIVEQCKAAEVPIFVKNSLKPYWEGELIQEWPEGLK